MGGLAATPERLTVRGVSKTYGAVNALHPTDLTIAKGEFVSLLGPSGSGKTTLLNIVAGLTTPSDGRTLLDGRGHQRPSSA